jgi:hypothetical protein
MTTKLQKRSTVQNRLDSNWSLAVKIAAGFRCQCCNRVKKDLPGKQLLNSHHIIRREVKIFRWDLSNGICLCYVCHAKKAHALHFIAQLKWHAFIKLRHSMWMHEKYGVTWSMAVDTVKDHPEPTKDLPIKRVREIDAALKLVVKGYK